MDPKKWGPTVWWFLQWMAHQVDSTIMSMRLQGHVDNTATNIQGKLLKQYTQVVDSLGEFLLPCRSCQESTKIFLKHIPSKNVMRQFNTLHVPLASEWVLSLHNLVNTKLQKPQWSTAQLADMRSSSEFQDFPVAKNVMFIEQCIRYCLTKWPNKKRKFVQVFREYLAQLFLTLYTYGAYTSMNKTQSKHLLDLSRRYAGLTA